MLSLGLVLLLGAQPKTPPPPKTPEPVKQPVPPVSAGQLPTVEEMMATRAQVLGDVAKMDFGDDGGIKARLLAGDLTDAIFFLTTGDGGTAVTPKYVWKVPDLQHYIDVPSVQIVNGLPVRFSAAVSSARATFLLKYYVDEFTKAGLYIPPADHQFQPAPPVVQVTGLDTDSLTSYTAILQVVDEKHTTVIMSQGYLTPWLKKNHGGTPAEPDFAPLFPQADRVVRSKTEGADFIQFTTASDPLAVHGFYREVMTKAGYRERSKDLYKKGSEAIRVSAMRNTARKETGVILERRLTADESSELAP